ncbi:hypothetical protein V2J09_003807, partial [Rumex salicifolius]
GRWLLKNNTELTTSGIVANCLVFFFGIDTRSFEGLTSRSSYLRKILKLLYGAKHLKSLVENCLLLVIGNIPYPESPIVHVLYI